jgi:hypothetical protein
VFLCLIQSYATGRYGGMEVCGNVENTRHIKLGWNVDKWWLNTSFWRRIVNCKRFITGKKVENCNCYKFSTRYSVHIVALWVMVPCSLVGLFLSLPYLCKGSHRKSAFVQLTYYAHWMQTQDTDLFNKTLSWYKIEWNVIYISSTVSFRTAKKYLSNYYDFPWSWWW